MNNISTDGFKRRPGLNLSSHQVKSLQATQLEFFQNQINSKFNKAQRKTQRCLQKNQDKQNKFNRLRNNSIQIKVDFFNQYKQKINDKNSRQSFLESSNHQKKMKNLIENLKPRGSGIYKFGFRSYQKTNKKIFCQVFNILPSKMKGTMHIGQLWSNHETSKFMKSNKIYMNKMKLIDKLRQVKKQMNKQQESSLTTIDSAFTNRTISTKHILNCGSNKTYSFTKLSNKSFNLTNMRELNSTMSQISKDLSDLKKTEKQKNKSKLKYLQLCNQKMQKLEGKYLDSMLQNS